MSAVDQQSFDSQTWRMLGRQVPRTEVVFLCQVLVVFVVIVSCIVNLSLQRGQTELWVALLSSSLGYMLPNPSLDIKRRHNRGEDTVDHGPVLRDVAQR